MTKKLINYFLPSLLLVLHISAFGQTELPDVFDYSVRKTYEIGGLVIHGAETRDRNAIKSIAGFREGDKISIPGLDIPRAIKSLMRLKLFDDVQLYIDSIVNDNIVYLSMEIIERPLLSKFSFTGVKKSEHDDLTEIVNGVFTKDGIVTEDQKNLGIIKIKEHYMKKGLLDATVAIKEVPDVKRPNSVILTFNIAKKARVKVEKIVVNGNKALSDRKVRKKMKNTKQKGTLFRKTKFIESDYEEDKKSVIEYYNSLGYKNARILKDTTYRTREKDIVIELTINEGKIFHYRNIKWKGNSIYSVDQLNNVLGVTKGDVYNPKQLDTRLKFSLDGRDVSSLYLDDGYLAFNVDPVEVAVTEDSIDIEMRIFEGPQFTIDNVVIEGNDRTHEHVIRRDLRTRPGSKFSRSQIIRSQREIVNLGYFNPEALGIETPVNQSRGTVDIVYKVEERPSDQLELSAGYGGASGLIGTLGVTFNNFSLRNIRDRSTWSPLPQGDGQKLSLRIQSNSRFYKSYNFTFTEPWLGGKRPNSFTIGAVSSVFDNTSFGSGKFSILRFFTGLGSQLKWPDDFFSQSTTLNIENIKLSQYNSTIFQVDGVGISNGNFKNISISQTFARSSINDPLFPRSGSRISLTVKLTPPYSLFRKNNNPTITMAERNQIISDLIREYGPAVPPTEEEIDQEVNSRYLARKYEWLEYHKWTFNSEWYFNLVGKLVLMSQAKMGFLGNYNNKLGLTPFERYEIGGDGLSNANNQITGRDILAMRGYATDDFPANSNGGAALYNKYTLELRYPLSLNPSSTIYVTSFLQAANAWKSFSEFNPFDVKRSGGMGLRVFLPMFGLLGFDYGFGFDKDLGPDAKATDFAKFNIIIGFEPE